MADRIYLSPPSAGPAEEEAVLRALRSGWVAPAGPEIEAFEAELADRSGRAHAVALSSGTAGLHLLLVALGVGTGDDVLVSSLTFVASVNPILYVGANPVLVDSEPVWWNIDPDLVAAELERRLATGRHVGAVIAVDLYGRCADHRRLTEICAAYDVPLLVDAAESLGAARDGLPAGGSGRAAVFSFNGNKIITTSGGGAVVTDDAALAARVRHLSTQAREPEVHYEHIEVGFNYRMSNILAALGRVQLSQLDDRMSRRRWTCDAYRAAFADIEGLSFPDPVADEGWNGWLTCVLLDPAASLPTPHEMVNALERHDIEARPAWKPMHRQPLFSDTDAVLTGVADSIFAGGLCLPSGDSISDEQRARVIEAVRGAVAQAGGDR